MKKISYGKIVLILMYAFVSLFALMFVNSIFEASNDDMYYNEFFSSNMRKIYIPFGQASEFPYKDLGDDYALYFNIAESIEREADYVRAVYTAGNVAKPNILEGRFFTEEELNSSFPVAVLGTLCKRNVTERDGKEYYTYAGKEYEVIGYMGLEDQITDVDNMVWLNMGAYFEKTSVYGKFFVDSDTDVGTSAVVSNLLDRLSDDVKEQTAEIIHERKIRSISYYTQKIYRFVIIAIIINIAIVSVYYIDKRMHIISVKKLIGASFGSIAKDIITEYVSFSAGGVVLGIICAFLLRFTQFADSDEVFFMSFSAQSLIAMFGITVLLAIIVSVVPIIRVYRSDLSQKIK